MTLEIALVLTILLISLILFVTEKVRMDVVSLLVLAALALTGLVSPSEALSGFSNAAVITVWAMFIISAGLTKTNVANMIGHQVLRFAGKGETFLIIVVMVTGGVLSAFMNNIGVAALMLPISMGICRRTGIAPSRLLMPMAYGTLLGGLTTLIGTPPNLLVSDALRNNGLEPFQLFDFTPVGAAVMTGSILFIALAGKYVLPKRDPIHKSEKNHKKLKDQYALQERTCVMKLNEGSLLEGKKLAQMRLGSAFSLTVFSIVRNKRHILAPDPSTTLMAGDRLLVGGRLNRFNELRRWQEFTIEEEQHFFEKLVSNEIHLAEVGLSPQSSLIKEKFYKTDFRKRFGLNVLAIRKNGEIKSKDFSNVVLEEGDKLLVQGKTKDVFSISDRKEFNSFKAISKNELPHYYQMHGKVYCLKVPENSVLKGKTLKKSRLGEILGIRVLVIMRDQSSIPMPGAEEILMAGDRLLVESSIGEMEIFQGLQQLEIEEETTPDLDVLESGKIGLAEAVLSPRTNLACKTIKEINFREKYGVQVIAIWHSGRAYRSRLGDIQLDFGDALLLLGPRDKMNLLSKDSDFILLTEEGKEELTEKEKAPLAIAILVFMLMPVILGWLPISIAAVAGATVMVLTGCLNMEEAYKSIDWRSVFLIAGMLPLGIAMQETGAANFIAEKVVAVAGGFGPWGVLIGLYLITTIATSIIPTAALVVLMAPIVLKTSADMGLSPHSLMMAIAIAASASFTSPISHPANVLVMGPGGYKFTDYMKLGIPLTLIVMVIGLFLLSLIWPLTP